MANLLYLFINNNNNINFKFKCNYIHTFTALANAKLTPYSKVLRLNKTIYPTEMLLTISLPLQNGPLLH